MSTRTRWAAYLALARVQFRTSLTYRANYLITIVGVLAQVYLLTTVWTAVYAGRGSIDGVTLGTAVVYSTLAVVQYTLFFPYFFSQIPQRVRDGTVGMDLLRPVGFVAQNLAGQTGVTVALLPAVLLALPGAVVVGGLAPPSGSWAGVGYVLSLAGAYVVTLLLSVLVGCIAFWTTELGGVLLVFRTVSQFFSGALVPLWVMPDWLRTAVMALPFQATTYTPTAIYVGALRGEEAVTALVQQGVWIVVLGLLCWWVWSRAVHRVVVAGG